MSDIASIDLSAGTFYADVDIFVLKYYRAFLDRTTALGEATRVWVRRKPPGGRARGARWCVRRAVACETETRGEVIASELF